MKQEPAPLWRRLWPLAGLVLAVHLALLQGGWRALTPTRDRWVQQFTTRIIAVPPQAPAPAPPEPEPPQPLAAAPAPERGRSPAPPAEKQAPVRSDEPAAPESKPSPNPDPGPPPTAATPFVPNTIGVPQPSVMRYEVTTQSRGGTTLAGQARLDWWHNGQQYDLKLEITTPGARDRVQISSGMITDEGLAPNRFSDKSRSEQATHFDRANRRIVFSNNSPQAALAPGMQDRLSVLVQLSMLLAGEPARFTPGTQLAIPTAGTREAGDWVFRVGAEEELDLPGGRVRALKLEKPPRGAYDQGIELWLAPGKDYAPVRLRLTNPDGGTVDQRWSSTDRG